jgi:hypothetical protein
MVKHRTKQFGTDPGLPSSVTIFGAMSRYYRFPYSPARSCSFEWNPNQCSCPSSGSTAKWHVSGAICDIKPCAAPSERNQCALFFIQ